MTTPSQTTARDLDAASATAERRTRRRRFPLSLAALLGAAGAGAYAVFAMRLGFGPPLVVVALGGATLVFSAAALWRVIAPLTGDADASSPGTPEVRVPHRVRELEREKQAVLKAIKEIELDYQMRKIAEPDYREMIERYRARALRVIGELSAGDDYRSLIERELKARLAAMGSAGLEAKKLDGNDVVKTTTNEAALVVPSRACPDCTTVNDADARFCKRCGQKLG